MAIGAPISHAFLQRDLATSTPTQEELEFNTPPVESGLVWLSLIGHNQLDIAEVMLHDSWS